MVMSDTFMTMSGRRKKQSDAAAPRKTMREAREVGATIPAGEFKAKCLAIFDDVERRRRSLVVTKRGRPVARVVPLTTGASGSLRGSLIHEEDLIAPVNAPWDA